VKLTSNKAGWLPLISALGTNQILVAHTKDQGIYRPGNDTLRLTGN
jgi:hypothetical protein